MAVNTIPFGVSYEHRTYIILPAGVVDTTAAVLAPIQREVSSRTRGRQNQFPQEVLTCTMVPGTSYLYRDSSPGLRCGDRSLLSPYFRRKVALIPLG